MSLSTIRLGDHVLKIGSGATPRGGKEVYLNIGTISFIRSQNIYNNSFEKSGLVYLTEEQAEELSNVEVCPDDILLNITGDSVARVCQVPNNVLPARVNQHVAIVRPIPEKINAGFLRYFLVSSEMQTHMLGLAASGATRPALTKGMIENFKIPFFSIENQKAIAGVLGALDHKIELNRRMNATLEAMARALFKSWFVNFDPVRAKMEGKQPFGMDAATAALFPSRLTPSPLGDIPEGWGVKKFGDIIEPQKGKSITKKTVSEGDVPVVAGGLDPAYYHNVSNAEAPVITVSASGANAGFIRLYYENVWASDCSYINKAHTPFVYSAYALLKSRQEEIYAMQQGAAQPHIYPSDIMRLEVVNPSSAIWKALERLISSFHMQIAVNYSEIKSLEVIRDYLLPKLISGDIRIPNVEKFVEVA